MVWVNVWDRVVFLIIEMISHLGGSTVNIIIYVIVVVVKETCLGSGRPLYNWQSLQLDLKSLLQRTHLTGVSLDFSHEDERWSPRITWHILYTTKNDTIGMMWLDAFFIMREVSLLIIEIIAYHHESIKVIKNPTNRSGILYSLFFVSGY